MSKDTYNEGDTIHYGQVVNFSEMSVKELNQGRKELEHTTKCLANKDGARRRVLVLEMHRLQDVIWANEERPRVYVGQGTILTEDESSMGSGFLIEVSVDSDKDSRTYWYSALAHSADV